jgi:hypothetical protein
MYEVPTDTIVDSQQFTAQPNTAAPIVAINHGGEVNQYQWVSPRNIALIAGGLVVLVIGAIAMRSTAITTDQVIKVEPLAQPTVKAEEVNKAILERSIEDLNTLIFLTNERLAKDKPALQNERAKEITAWGNKLVTDRNSSCYKSVYQRKCFISIFLKEQIERYKDAYRSRKWEEANKALFQIESARIAWVGSGDLPLDGDATVSAIRNELERRIEVEQQSDNAIAAEMFGGKQQ